MSSDLFNVEIIAVRERELELECRPTGAAGPDDEAVTRSFAFLVLLSFDEAVGGGPRWRRAVAEVAGARYDVDFFRMNIGRFIERTELLDRTPGRYCLRVVLAKSLTFQAPVHSVCSTTAYDVWPKDPENPLEPTLRDARGRELEQWLADQSAASSASLERKFDGLIETLLTNGLIELAVARDARSKLVKQLARLDADDEASLSRKIIDVLSKSKVVEEVYGADEELFAVIRGALE